MDIKKIILEEINDFDWIEDVNPDLRGRVIRFEPMIEVDKFYDDISGILEKMGITWSSGKSVRNMDVLNDAIYLHHLIIEPNGKMSWGGIDEDLYYEMYDEGYTDDEIITDYSEGNRDIKYFTAHINMDDTSVNGREYFSIPNNINESEDFDWIRGVPDEPIKEGVKFTTGRRQEWNEDGQEISDGEEIVFEIMIVSENGRIILNWYEPQQYDPENPPDLDDEFRHERSIDVPVEGVIEIREKLLSGEYKFVQDIN
jgi:hypothetical protein